MEFVYDLWYVREVPDGEDHSFHIGIYSTKAAATAAIERLRVQRGFRDRPDCFEISQTLLDQDSWEEGFVSWAEADRAQDEELDGPRLRLTLLIIHPTLSPEEIGAALALEARTQHKVGDRQPGRAGTLRSDRYQETRWAYEISYVLDREWFANQVGAFLGEFSPHAAFFRRVTETGGKAQLNLVLIGDYFADEISRQTLSRAHDLHLDIWVEFQAPPSAKD